jgi:signal transduction histidine kinase
MNAIHASNPGDEVVLSVQQETRERGAESQEFVVLSVVDHGAGVSDEHRERIFEPFFTTKPAGEGTGLGLSVVRDIVQEHDGQIELSTQEGKGSIFKLLLPKGAAHGDSRVGD